MAQLVAQHQDAYGSDGIYKQGVRSVEGINKASSTVDIGPATGQHCTRYFQCQFIEVLFPFVKRNFSFHHEAEQIAISTRIVEAMVTYAGMADMGCHQGQGISS